MITEWFKVGKRFLVEDILTRYDWKVSEGDGDPDRSEIVYNRRLRGGGQLRVVWHDGNTEKWQWFHMPMGWDEPHGVSEGLFSTPGLAKAAADIWATKNAL